MMTIVRHFNTHKQTIIKFKHNSCCEQIEKIVLFKMIFDSYIFHSIDSISRR